MGKDEGGGVTRVAGDDLQPESIPAGSVIPASAPVKRNERRFIDGRSNAPREPGKRLLRRNYFLFAFFSRFSARFSFSVFVGFFFVSLRASCDFAMSFSKLIVTLISQKTEKIPNH